MKVFIADDSDAVRERLIEMFSDIPGVEIIGQAKDVPQAKASILKLNPDVVILDIRMPGGSGFDVLKFVKNYNPDFKVIMLTGYPYLQYRKKCKEDGADYFFDKSTEFEKVVEVLKKLVNETHG